MKQFETKKDPKSTIIFHCKLCNYTSCKKSLYERHLSTGKHQKISNETNMKQNSTEKFHCMCGHFFNSRTTLWRHKNKCSGIKIQNDNTPSDKELIMILVKQNTELLEVIKNGTHNTTTNTNSHNKTFNLQFFLHLWTFKTPFI